MPLLSRSPTAELCNSRADCDHVDLPNAAHDYTTPRSGAPAFSNSANTLSRQTTSLPSFAALSEQTSRTEEPDEVEIAPMSARLSCNQCAKLGPLIREVATAVAELDGSVQSLGNSSSSRASDACTMPTMMQALTATVS